VVLIVSYLPILTVAPCLDKVQWADLSLVQVHLNLMDLVPVDPVCQTLLQTVVLLVIFAVNHHQGGLDLLGHLFHLVLGLMDHVVLTVHPIVAHLGLMDLLTNFSDLDHQGLTILAHTVLVLDSDHPMDQWAHMDLCMVLHLILWTDGRCPCCNQTIRSLR